MPKRSHGAAIFTLTVLLSFHLTAFSTFHLFGIISMCISGFTNLPWILTNYIFNVEDTTVNSFLEVISLCIICDIWHILCSISCCALACLVLIWHMISCIRYHISYTMYHISYIAYHISRIICHMSSCTMCHVSYVIRHTSSISWYTRHRTHYHISAMLWCDVLG